MSLGAAGCVHQRTVSPGSSHLPVASLFVYPATLLLGSLYSFVSPTAKPLAPNLSSSTTAPDRPPTPVNYFANKSNIFNIYFVKIGWLWTTIAFVLILLTQPGFVNRRLDANERLRRAWQAIFRYALVTLAWVLTTQWCFGPAIIDRSFTATGGRCERLDANSPAPDSIMTAVACKLANGSWKGGHDVSGHAFMLVLASAFLVFELLGSSVAVSETLNSKDKPEIHQSTGTGQSENGQTSVRMVQNFVWAVAGLCWWMLLMTGIWFHTFIEKTSGLILALFAVYVIYILPRAIPLWRRTIGVPGI
ncbi:hypothetical protein LOZ12_003327 [Ophidiomyces ophidiicola]|uniref:Uncharacterized protein n=1 Tax=Ophidiomyces ophidiicola TaxID=1387563 RepID=A0ACB8UWT4_9EURO|nr:uncharacterized protein LOZ57_002292 [Ophidiomyces ophidiicola]KAI1912266.1 hypothetical protein LOZ61_003428 [Ophidiomyces ophidiicola]KAI1920509.1 hypothetical protein LOZ64_001825 [Ophidiomyces ophidiicola]KAI1928078.1 hypothetical protein LOZ60_002571 [Ophidiomyces ophidiicola]KAI1946005.1 hypothetical protein LOZ62_003483 [Ophidiomyces ophidiicola]KAI1949814.1 hypothetical protein LOZ57_002292 [Ophidiomyces ophidiicola]